MHTVLYSKASTLEWVGAEINLSHSTSSALTRMLTMASTSMRSPLCLLLAFWPNVPDGRFLWLEVMPAKAAPWRRKVSEVDVGDPPFYVWVR